MSSTGRMRILITGASGLVGSHLAEETLSKGISTRLLARDESKVLWLKARGAEIIRGDLNEPHALKTACQGITHIIHCAAMVGDWGSREDYLKTNLGGVKNLIESIDAEHLLRFIHLSSLGVYEARDHLQTDESVPMARQGVDGYTHSKIKAEEFVQEMIREKQFPAVILRPGFIYGRRDQTILPKLIESLKAGRVRYLGSPDNRVNNTYVGNLVEAVLLSLEHPSAVGQTFNVTDPRLVSKQEFMETICSNLRIPAPTRRVPYKVARKLASVMEAIYRLMGRTQAPLLSQGRVKFLGANLDYSIQKARTILGYQPSLDFTEAMQSVLNDASERQAA